jgi:hypothetical protein
VEALVVDDAFERELEWELQMVREAVMLVAAGGARRVVVANLRHGRVILEPARAFAVDLGLDIEVLSTDDPRRVDLAAGPPVAAAPPVVAAPPVSPTRRGPSRHCRGRAILHRMRRPEATQPPTSA